MRKSILFLFMLLAWLQTSYASSAEKRYTSFLTEKGMLYFVRPMHMPKCETNETKYGMTFDITYLSGDEDSVSFTTTIVTPTQIRLDSVNVRNHHLAIKRNTELIYCEPYKKYYVNRIRFYIRWEEWKELYKQPQPYIIDFGPHLHYAFKTKQWKKECETINNIIRTIEINQRQK